MRLEVIVDNEEPLIFPLNRPKIFIGSHESCEIVLTADGVSRKHVAVICEEDNYFVIDQGSTNGTYINEERLIPGRRSEFTSFFPVRLGDNVLLTLLSDEEASEEPLSSLSAPVEKIRELDFPLSDSSKVDSTRVLSLKDLKSASTTELVKKKLEKQAIRKTPGKKVVPKKKPAWKFKISWVKFLALVLLAGGVYFNMVIKKGNEKIPAPPPAKVGEVVKSKKVEDKKTELKADSASGIATLSDEDLTPPAKILNIFNGFKCSTDLEKYFCSNIIGSSELPWGAVQEGMKLYILIDRSKIKPSVDGLIARSPRVLKDLIPEDQTDLMHLLFWSKLIPQDIKLDDLKDLKLFAVFFDSPEKIHSISAILPENLPRLWTAMMGSKGIDEIRQRGIIRARRFKEFYTSY